MDDTVGQTVLVVTELSSGQDIELLRQQFELVAAEEGWCPGGALREEWPTSHYFAASVKGCLAGGLQVVLPTLDGQLPYQRLWPEIKLTDPCRTAHITILALTRDFRGQPTLFWSLCGELWRFLIAEDMHEVVLEATPPMLSRYRRLGFPLEEIGPTRLHWGENCLLARMDLRTVAGAMLTQARRSPIYRTLITSAARPYPRRRSAVSTAAPE